MQTGVIKNEMCATLKNKSRKMNFKGTDCGTENGATTNSQTLIDGDVKLTQFIKDEKPETSIENEEYAIITIENYTIKTEPETNIHETLVGSIIDDRSSIESGDVQMIMKDKLTELTTNENKNKSVDLKKQKSTFKGERRHGCTICKKKFSSLGSLKVHCRSHTGEKPYTCTECNQNFFIKSSLNLHMRRHTGEKPYTCTECGQKFSIKSSLKRHMTRHTGEKLYSCAQCDKSFSIRNSLNLHMRRHTGQKPYACTECKQCFARKEGLDIHMKRHTGEKPFTCTVCNKSFAVKQALKHHMRQHTGEKPYSCTQCGKNFAVKQGLNLHMKQHISGKSFKCTECEQCFSRKHALNLHMQRHTGEKPHVCNECGKRFLRAIELRYHSKIHVRPFACNQCEEKFKTLKRLEQHTKIHSSRPKRKYTVQKYKLKCKECKTSYATEEELKTHYDMGVHIVKYTSSSQKDSRVLEIQGDHPEVLHNDSPLKQIHRIDTFNENQIENITTTDNNEILPVKYEVHASVESSIINEYYLADKMTETATEISPNKKDTEIKIEPQDIEKTGIVVHQFIKDEVAEECAEQLLIENEVYTVITLGNKTIKKEPQTTESEPLTAANISDQTYLKSTVTVQEVINDKLTKINIEPLLLKNELDAKNLCSIHESKNTEERHYACDFCEKKLPKLSVLKKHLRSHTGEKPYICLECNQSFSVKESLNRHMRQHTGKKPFTCTKCKQCFTRKEGLDFHMRRHTGEKPYKCTECNNSFAFKQALRRHMRQHTGEKPYICTECNESFSLKETLNLHIKRHTGEKPYKCVECNQSFSVKETLDRHMKRHTGEKPHTCTECNKKFAVKKELNVHMKRHTGEKPFTCTECNQSFAAKRSLHNHMRRHTGEKPYTCTECNKSFSIKSSLNLHMKRHTGEKPHACDDCGKRFILAIELRYHSKTHLCPYACDQCEEKFKTKKKLEHHIKNHISKSKRKKKVQEHKFKCKDCTATYATDEELKLHYDIGVHIVKHTSSRNKDIKEGRIECTLCHKEFDSVQVLQCHMLQIHEGHPESFHNSNNCLKLELKNSDSTLTKIDDNQLENVTRVHKNSILSVKYEEQISIEKNQICAENKSIKMEPGVTHDQTSIENSVIGAQFIKST